MRTLSGSGHLSICAFVSKNTAEKTQYRMKLHKIASEQIFSGRIQYVLLYIGNLHKSLIGSQPNSGINNYREVQPLSTFTYFPLALVYRLFYLTKFCTAYSTADTAEPSLTSMLNSLTPNGAHMRHHF
jgi:hypothetical protein